MLPIRRYLRRHVCILAYASVRPRRHVSGALAGPVRRHSACRHFGRLRIWVATVSEAMRRFHRKMDMQRLLTRAATIAVAVLFGMAFLILMDASLQDMRLS